MTMKTNCCPTCGGTGEIDDPAHLMHPSNTGDGTDETWCLDCDGMGTREAYDEKLAGDQRPALPAGREAWVRKGS